MGKRRRRHERLSGRTRGILAALIAIVLAGGTAIIATAAIASSRADSAPVADYTAEPMPTRTPLDTITLVGDSFVNGSDQNSSQATMWHRVMKLGLPVYFDVFAKGGIGYEFSRDDQNMGSLIERMSPGTDLLIIFAGRNDRAGYQPVHDAALADFQRAKEIAPNTAMLVVGPLWPQPTPAPGPMRETRDAVRDAATEVGARFVDPIAERWFVDTPELIGTDGVHPNDEGQKRLAEIMAPLILETYAASK